MAHRFSLGIDLGTSNSAWAFSDHSTGTCREGLVPQITAPGQVGQQALLPSCLYIPHKDELSPKDRELPWSDAPEPYVVGAYAREQGSLVPSRCVHSAKSWLCSKNVDPKSPILPWLSDIKEAKISPYAASVAYLKHLRQAFLNEQKLDSLSDVQAVITVPASFNEWARTLTHEAALEAGFKDPILLEEPQAAFYAWLYQSGEAWREQVQPGDRLLVCDIGGGTADFSFIAVQEQEGTLHLERISVGDHILLGGDNMDLALAYALSSQLEAQGKALDDWQFRSLVHAARSAKETLLSRDDLDTTKISIAGKGSSLFKSLISCELKRSMLQEVILDGFFPKTTIEQEVQEGSQTGLHEMGLHYEADPVFSRHLAAFLRQSLSYARNDPRWSALLGLSGAESYLKPTAVLFNGGVFNASEIRARVMGLLKSWSEGADVRELQSCDLDLAVAKGAAYYGYIKSQGQGVRIKSGVPHSYYIGIETTMPAVPGLKPPMKALCTVPQGMQEGTRVALEGKEFGLVTGKEVHFRFFSSSVRPQDTVGSWVHNAEKELSESTELSITIPPAHEDQESSIVPVELESCVTELGVLELWMKHKQSDKRWKLEFKVRSR